MSLPLFVSRKRYISSPCRIQISFSPRNRSTEWTSRRMHAFGCVGLVGCSLVIVLSLLFAVVYSWIAWGGAPVFNKKSYFNCSSCMSISRRGRPLYHSGIGMAVGLDLPSALEPVVEKGDVYG